MRENKFRAWYSGDIEKGEPLLFEQKEIDHELFFVCKESPEIMYPFYIPFIDSDWIVEEYSGKKDKNGVEIYEGDILKIKMEDDWQDLPYIIQNVLEFGSFIRTEDVDRYYCVTDYYVIGNIHDRGESK